MISVLVYIIVICIVMGLLYWIALQLPLPEPFGRIVQVCILVIGVLLVVLALLGLIGVGPGLQGLR
ncbi:MAG: hypothetical protein ABWY64_11800 [Tardiphaga sp.]